MKMPAARSRTATPKPRAYNQSARAEAAEATGKRIVDAFLARLMAQWFDEITLDQIAADAGTTVQTIVRRFGSKEGLLEAGIAQFGAQVNAKRECEPGDVDAMVSALFKDYEESGDAVIRLLALEPRHSTLKPVMDYGRAEHRRWVEAAMVPYLAQQSTEARRRMSDALVMATDVYAWQLARRDMGRSIPASKALIKATVKGIISEFAKLKSSGDGQ